VPGSGCSALEGINRGQAVLGGATPASPSIPATSAVALAAFDGIVDTLSPRGTRSIPILEFHSGAWIHTADRDGARNDELIVRSACPRRPWERIDLSQGARSRVVRLRFDLGRRAVFACEWTRARRTDRTRWRRHQTLARARSRAEPDPVSPSPKRAHGMRASLPSAARAPDRSMPSRCPWSEHSSSKP